MTKHPAHKLMKWTLVLGSVLMSLVLVSQAHAQTQIDIPGPVGSAQFGGEIRVLPNGNIVVADPGYDIASPTMIANVGAVHLYDGKTGALISTLTGSTAFDQVGSGGIGGVIVLSNGNYLVRSQSWDDGAKTDVGAVTWCNATTGCAGVVSPANSLIGSTMNDNVGLITALSNGNYVVVSSSWNNGAIVDAGAVTFCNGTTGRTGTISPANSLVGSILNDFVGIVTALSNGNYVVASPLWNNVAIADAGAATFCDGTTGCTGTISASNSLVGGATNHRVGSGGITGLSNGNFVVRSTAGANNVGAVTLCSGATGCTATLSSTNSLVGTTADDQIGSSGVIALSNGNYVVRSVLWNNTAPAAVDAGAVTWCSGTTGCVGAVSSANSLVGSAANDNIGDIGVTLLSNGNFVVNSSVWNNVGVVNAGAVTFCSGTTGCSGAVSASNSLVGSTTNDNVGSAGIAGDVVTELSNGNYVVVSPTWDGAAVNAGAATLCSGTTGCVGTITASNSLVGGTLENRIGNNGVTALSNGNYVVISQTWDDAASNVGAVTFCDGTAGCTGVVSAANSLVGSAVTDSVGNSGVTRLNNGNYVVRSRSWDNVGVTDAGAVTWCDGTVGCTGPVTTSNSLVGSTSSDQVGNALTALNNGNYVVVSADWNIGANNVGSVTWCNGATGRTGPITPSISLVGSAGGDNVGSGGVTALGNGNYVVRSSSWDNATVNATGAITFCDGTSGCAGPVSSSNSLVGSTNGDAIGGFGVTALSNNNYVVRSQSWDGPAIDSGAITYGAGYAATTIGIINATNSVRGTAPSGGLNLIPFFDAANQQLVVGRSSDNVVSIFRPNHSAIADGNWGDSATWNYGLPGQEQDVVIPNGRNVTLNVDATVRSLTVEAGGTLTLSNGKLTVANFVSVACTGAITGGSDLSYIVGSIKKDHCTTGVFNYPTGTPNGYSPVTANITALATNPSILMIRATQGPHPNAPMPASALRRYWTLTETGDLTATLTFNYLQADVPAIPEGTLELKRYTGSGTIFDTIPATLDIAGNTATTANGISEFSDWTLLSPDSPTAIDLIAFNATKYDTGTLVEWRTGFEADNLGFNVYRGDGKRELVNSQIIAGSALRAGSVLRSGQSYAWWDKGIADCGLRIADCQNAAYWLEDIDLSGASRWHGPFYPRFDGGKPPAQSNAARLSEVATRQAQSSESRAVEAAVVAAPANKQQQAVHASLVTQSAAKISVKREGWYRITRAELASIGFDIRVDGRFLQLFVDGRELPALVRDGEDGSFGSVEFYGQGLNSPFSDSRVYWLVAGNQPGQRISQTRADGANAASLSFTHAVERRDRTIYFAALRNGERENFFGAVIAQNPVDQALTISHVAGPASPGATLEVALQGVTLTAHSVNVEFNGAQAGTISFHGQAQGVVTFPVPHALLREGTNTVRFTPLGGQSDVSLVDFIRISYQHRYTADNNTLKLTGTGLQQLTIDGFTSESIRVIDVTDPNSPQEIIGAIEKQKTGYAVSFATAQAGERSLLAFTVEQTPASLSFNEPSSLRSGNTDFIIVTTREFGDSTRPLVALRQKQGLSVAIVDVEDIYDEFSFGQKTPFAVRDFLSYAKASWKKKPRFVMFAGDASVDPKNYLGFGDLDFIPTKLIDTYYLETSSDDWLADFDNDGVADLAMGRLPARSAEELSTMIAKIIGYEQSGPAEEALLVADANDGFGFEQATEQLRTLIPANLRITQVNRGRVDPEMARRSLFSALYRKQFLVNYVGHGSVNKWRGNLLTNDDALDLRNDHLPLFVMMTCLNGYFHDPALDSLGESLLKAERGGAVAVWASSGMTLPIDQALMNQELYRQFFNQPRAISLGEAVMRAKSVITDLDIRRSWILLGDPTMKLR